MIQLTRFSVRGKDPTRRTGRVTSPHRLICTCTKWFQGPKTQKRYFSQLGESCSRQEGSSWRLYRHHEVVSCP